MVVVEEANKDAEERGSADVVSCQVAVKLCYLCKVDQNKTFRECTAVPPIYVSTTADVPLSFALERDLSCERGERKTEGEKNVLCDSERDIGSPASRPPYNSVILSLTTRSIEEL